MDERELRRLHEITEHLRRQVEPALRTSAELQHQLDAVARAAVPPEVARTLDRFRTELAAGLRWQPSERWLGDLRRLQGWFSTNLESVVATLEQVQAAYRRTLSDNLQPLDSEVLAQAVRLMMEDDGVVVVWLPPSDVVVQLVEAASLQERDAIVVARGDEIASSAAEVLSVVDGPHLQMLRAALTEAWTVWGDGHRMAAQALATAALGTVVHELLAYDKFASLKNEWRGEDHDPLDHISLFEMRRGLLMVRTAIALEKTDYAIPGYNRHGRRTGSIQPITPSPMPCMP
jgi:hypothetical protein